MKAILVDQCGCGREYYPGLQYYDLTCNECLSKKHHIIGNCAECGIPLIRFGHSKAYKCADCKRKWRRDYNRALRANNYFNATRKET